ncbi:hypothetical protein C0993_008150, partial [Termitomyces sp. T159_Od127]
MFQAKPLTFQLESSCVAFATLYLQGITFDHYMALLQFNLNSPVLSNWQAFAQEFLNNALQFALCCALPQCIKDVLHLTPKQPTYNGYKALITQINQQYWKDCSEYSALQAPWNSSRNPNCQTGGVIGNQTTSAAPPLNPAAQPPLEQGPANTNQPLEPCPPAQLNTTNTQEALDPNHTNNNLLQDSHDIPDLVDDKVALCMSRFRNWPWIDVLEEMQELQQSMLAATPQRLPISIHLILFNGSSTSAGDIEKCEFKQTQIKYLGPIISHGATEMDLVKMAGVVEWPEPKNKKEVQAFLKFTNSYW